MPKSKQSQNYVLWRNILNRCHNPNNPSFRYYGARGISVFLDWRTSFDAFERYLETLGARADGFTLDRIDNNKGYEPGNLRWAPRRVQMRNQSVTLRVRIDGQEYVAANLADLAGVKTRTIVARAKRGLPLADVMDATPHTATSGLALGARIKREIDQARQQCRKGHQYTEDNTYVDKNGWRRCRECHRTKMRRLNEKKRLHVNQT